MTSACCPADVAPADPVALRSLPTVLLVDAHIGRLSATDGERVAAHAVLAERRADALAALDLHRVPVMTPKEYRAEVARLNGLVRQGTATVADGQRLAVLRTYDPERFPR